MLSTSDLSSWRMKHRPEEGLGAEGGRDILQLPEQKGIIRIGWGDGVPANFRQDFPGVALLARYHVSLEVSYQDKQEAPRPCHSTRVDPRLSKCYAGKFTISSWNK